MTKKIIEQAKRMLAEAEYDVSTIYDKCTVCVCKLKCGFVMVESSACVDPDNYDADLGKEICKERFLPKLAELLEYTNVMGSDVIEGNKITCEHIDKLLDNAYSSFENFLEVSSTNLYVIIEDKYKLVETVTLQGFHSQFNVYSELLEKVKNRLWELEGFRLQLQIYEQRLKRMERESELMMRSFK